MKEALDICVPEKDFESFGKIPEETTKAVVDEVLTLKKRLRFVIDSYYVKELVQDHKEELNLKDVVQL